MATKTPLTAPSSPPAATAPSAATGIGMPDFASRPTITPQMANWEPIEISISRVRMTSVMPTAATSAGAALTNRSRRLAGAKNTGLAISNTTSSTAYAAATDSSRRCVCQKPARLKLRLRLRLVTMAHLLGVGVRGGIAVT